MRCGAIAPQLLGIFLKGLKARMIPVTKEEAKLLRELYPEYKITRTIVQKSKRHHYYATESEGMMRAIAGTNDRAAEIVANIDREREQRKKRQSQQRS